MSDFTLTLDTPLQQPFQVGDWHVAPDLNRLTEIGDPTNKRTLEPRLMHLLCYLAANQGRVVSREQLTVELWPRVIVNENSLTRAVSELRKQLRLTDIRNIQYLQTIPKSGYRLLPAVRELGIDMKIGTNLAQPVSTTLALTNNGFYGPMRMAASVALLIAIATLQYVKIATQQLPVAINQQLIDSDELIFDQVIDEKQSLLGAQVSLSAHASAGIFPDHSEGISSPVLSPDGSAVAFLRYQENLSVIFLNQVDADNDPIAIFSSKNTLTNLQWSPVGNALLFASEPASFVPTLLNASPRKPDLIMLDLDTLTVRVLIDNTPEAKEEAATV